VKGAFVGRAVAEEDQDDFVESLHLNAEAHAGRHGHAARHDAVGAQVAGRHVGHVHGAAAPAAVAGLLAHKLGHHQRRLGAFGDAMAMPAVGAQDVIVRPQCGTGAHRGAFLADRKVHRAMDQPLEVQLLGRLLKGADQEHLPQHCV
jgi:hypothetical protein